MEICFISFSYGLSLELKLSNNHDFYTIFLTNGGQQYENDR